jgi:hypothetical protein
MFRCSGWLVLVFQTASTRSLTLLLFLMAREGPANGPPPRTNRPSLVQHSSPRFGPDPSLIKGRTTARFSFGVVLVRMKNRCSLSLIMSRSFIMFCDCSASILAESKGRLLSRGFHRVDDEYSSPWLVEPIENNRGLNKTGLGFSASIPSTTTVPLLRRFLFFLACRIGIHFDAIAKGLINWANALVLLATPTRLVFCEIDQAEWSWIVVIASSGIPFHPVAAVS